jgi:phage gp36-like protein
MAWIAITVDDLKDAKVAALVEACQTSALGTGQDDPTDTIIQDVVTRIRAEVAACRANSLDEDTTKIPADLKSLACRMIMRQCQSRLQIALNDDEREEQRNDLRYLERIAECKVPVSATDDPVTDEVQAGAVSPSIDTASLDFSAANQDGL